MLLLINHLLLLLINHLHFLLINVYYTLILYKITNITINTNLLVVCLFISRNICNSTSRLTGEGIKLSDLLYNFRMPGWKNI